MDTRSYQTFAVDLRQLVHAIGAAVDQVGVDDLYHGRRVGMMSIELARRMGMDEAAQQRLYDAGLLHDCGVSTTRARRVLVNELEWEGAQNHCDRGYKLLKGFAPLAHLAPIVLHHHQRWDDMMKANVDPDTAQAANIIYLTDRVDTLAAAHYGNHSLLTHVSEIRVAIAKHTGSLFAPHVVDAFLHAAESEAFWLGLVPEYVIQYQQDMAAQCGGVELNWQEFKGCAYIFADIIDAKSPYTEEHSFGVARLSGYLARKLDLPPLTCEMIEIAGLLHDLGKLQVPDEILDSAESLDEVEFSIMKSHSYATYQALRHIDGIGQIAAWAGYHHECVDGSGYPFHRKAGDLPLEARIVHIADIFQALAQDRPYRQAMAPDAILAVLEERVRKGLADGRVVGLVAANLAECMTAATHRQPSR